MKKRIAFLGVVVLLAVAPLVGSWVWNQTVWFRSREMRFVGTDYDLGGKYFPGYKFPQCCIVPWRTNTSENEFDARDDGDDYYGTSGYALFATRFDFPNADPSKSSNAQLPPQGSPQLPEGNKDYPNIVRLPEFVTDWKILAPRMLGGFSYALVDDPRSQHGDRLWTFDGERYPDPAKSKVTGVVPFVKIGCIDGPYLAPDAPERTKPADRWTFTVGGRVPRSFRVGVLTDGLDSTQLAPAEVFLRRVGGETIGSGLLQRNRFVDIHVFDIDYARRGDVFIVSAASAKDGAGAAITGIVFDPNPDP